MRPMILVALLLFTGSGQAAVYKCVDGAGKMHYQDRVCGAGKKPAGWNQSAWNVTFTDPGSNSEARRVLDIYAANRRDQDDEEQRRRTANENNLRSLRQLQVSSLISKAARLESSRVAGADTRGTRAIDRQVSALLGVEPEPVVSKPKKVFVPPPPPPPPNMPRFTKIKPNFSGTDSAMDNAGNSYHIDAAGQPTDRRTGKQCDLQGNTIRCN